MSSSQSRDNFFKAVERGDIDAVNRLISEGADVKVENDKGETPLHIAAVWGHKEVVEALLDKGANVNAEDEEGNTPLVLTTDEEIKTLLQSTAKLLEVAKSGNIQEVNSLISEGAKVNVKDQDNKTPLHWAAEKGHKEVVEALLDKGANVDAEDENGDTPLDLATTQDIRTLLQNTDELLKAAGRGDIDTVNDLINQGASVNATDQDGKTPLHCAAKNSHEEVVEALLGKDGIDVNLADKNKDTPLHSVLKKGNIDINVLNALLRKEGIDVNLADKNKDTPLHSVLKKDNIDINVLNALLGAKEINVNAQDKDDRTPLHLAAKKDNIDINVLNALLGAEGIDVNIKDKLAEQTPLHWAVVKGHKEAVEALLGKDGIDVNIEDKHGNTPFKLATDEGIKTLLQPAEKSDDGSAGGSSTDSEGGQEEEKRVGDDTELQSDNSKEGEKTSTTSAEQGTDVQDNDVGPVASTEPAQTEEQPSSFFGSLFSILMKPFSLIASFFGGFFHGCLGLTKKSLTHNLMMILLHLGSINQLNKIMVIIMTRAM
ncbi:MULTISPECIES: ankyrin repeat domain-containing protein [unclassified Wolbachia]|uniref:ankyrin repeat domain-containing protein n=1 Tax=unclassified Wolbachia TaxID=2640676 RepID=UPI001105F52B|nr:MULTISPECIES: ankyrin repeat domain-containing protein [unclassified Wolbachia]MDV6249355.1 ankyrin repeat domain-containing protein [Wolbachia endosymbiont of Zaprionus taronus]QVU15383.1 Ankyrin repeat domain protein [Wolbachia endosymbiont of Drosophila yakuba]QVU16607.1 Ankyrin repeat domain protein [Wolbachia endosymbiont of Drosophila santomea]QWE32156.1 Ankyrin repeat domain protein [Wolbachia endosymbiont of Drosophila simulans]TLW85327.1 ankryin [Wolbachia endosymbiont of Drosophil